MELKEGFVFRPLPPSGVTPQTQGDVPLSLLAQAEDTNNELGPLSDLVGEWEGKGFNLIWRPSSTPGQHHFLELNRTEESLRFDRIPGQIPNRGLLQADISMIGLTYLQQVSDANVGAGLHIEPGIWAFVPATTSPQIPPSVVRMATIPHGTAMIAQGLATTQIGSPIIPACSVAPFITNEPTKPISFPESTLSIQTQFRSPSNQLIGISQDMVNNPNSVLQAQLVDVPVESTTILKVSTTPLPVPGGGTANTAFLAGTVAGPNAVAAQVDATFWVEKLGGVAGGFQLQYSQTVLLNFNGLSWPHVSVGTLQKKMSASAEPQVSSQDAAAIREIEDTGFQKRSS